MRNIKFRGFTINEEKYGNGKDGWIYGNLLLSDNKKAQIQDVNDDNFFKFIDIKSIGQYTGLKDKNGKEIYEGDILELNKDGRIFYGTSDGLLAKKYQLVGFRDGAFMTCRNKHLIDDYDTYLWIISKYSIVAGNIYDNKNLLEEGE